MPRHPKHDYRRPCTYHITISKLPQVPDFSIVTGHPASAWIHYYPIGDAIDQSIRTVLKSNPDLNVYRYVIMPDHVHILIRAIRYLDHTIGTYIGKMKVASIQNAREKGIFLDSIFESDFYDRILRVDQSLNVVYQYVRTNPNRLLARKFNPDYFKRVNDVFNYGEIHWQAYGNMQLLDNPFKNAVICHRADEKIPKIAEANRINWIHTAENGGVLVSPFIAKAEKDVRNKIEEVDGKVILLVNEPFSERYKPSGHDFEQCWKGRLLIVAPDRLLPEGRPTWLFLNRMADWISRWY
ncbi:MAG: hypothetical protein K2N25_08645 [Muribaculaceae bacterium]|nr:hypothetical protein [Muribaculaceae bacterium]